LGRERRSDMGGEDQNAKFVEKNAERKKRKTNIEVG
jgi:hypothetical protein